MTNASVSSGRSVASDPLKARPTGRADGVDDDGLGHWWVLSIVSPAVAHHGRSPRRSHTTGPLYPARTAGRGGWYRFLGT